MKKIISIVLVTLLITGSMLMFSGCSGDKDIPEEPQNVAMVLGIHDYFPDVNLRSKSIYDIIYTACLSFGRVTTIISDGEAYLAGDYTISKPDRWLDNTKKKQMAKQSANQIVEECSAAVAKTPEINTLKAIIKAADTIRSSEGNQTIMVIDSALSTCEPMNFAAQNLIDADPQLVVQQLEELHAIPDLNGMNVVFNGIGQVCGEQKKLTESYKFKLKELWNAILTAGGAKSVTFNTEPLSDVENDADLPYCSVVPVIEDALDLDGAMPDVVKLDQNKISFVSDEDEFLNEADAYSALEPIADVLKRDTDFRVMVVGTTATGNKEGCLKLSQMRADKVKKILVELEVNPEQIETYGAGQESPFKVIDIKDGKLIESEAAKNRAVYIINEASPIANKFK